MLSVVELTRNVREYQPEADLSTLERAYEFAERAHGPQLRKSGEPYFVHPVSVACTLAEMRLDLPCICAGLLHDVVEDTTVEIAEIEKNFGGEVAELVDGLTKLSQLSFSSKEDRQAESFRKMLAAMGKDVRVLLVKLCDRLDNMRTMDHMKPASQERICRETADIYAPLAHRLGLYEIKNELEDLSLKYLEPEAYKLITQRLESSRRERDKYIEGVNRTVTKLLAERDLECQIDGRARHITSVFRRMRALKCEFEQIFDLVAFQLRVDSVADCYAALGVLHSKWTPVPGGFKDYIALRKANRYQSLHTTLVGPGRQRMEVHIRTHEMHNVAQLGVVAQLQQSSSKSKPVEDPAYAWVKDMEPYQRDLRDPAEFLQVIKTGLFADEVYVFTPKGDVKILPRGSTPLDFAYGIHTELGEHCDGARINGQRVSIRHKLRSGDHVEVVTDAKRSPSKDWLECCVTPRARSGVRNFLRTQHRRKSLNLGKELMENEMHREGMSLGKLLKNAELLEHVLLRLKIPSADELFLALGFGRVQPRQVVGAVRACSITAEPDAEADDSTPVPELKPGAIEKLVRKVKGKDVNGIRVDGFDSVLVRFARCCNPLPGDPIIGFITRGRGVAIHRRDCSKAFDTTDPMRRVEVNWGSGTRIMRLVSLSVTTRNSPGILAKVSEAFSDQKINLKEANCRASDDGQAENTFTFLAADVTQLRNVMNALSKVQGVVDVSRV